MTTSQLLAAHLKHDLGTLKWHLADFADADYFVRPCPGANHAMWQVGHVLASTGRLLTMIDELFNHVLLDRFILELTRYLFFVEAVSIFIRSLEFIQGN